MARKLKTPPELEDTESRQGALERRLQALRDPNPVVRARAVRALCPCRTRWQGPEEECLLELRRDPDRSVQQALKHVLIDEIRENPRAYGPGPSEHDDRSRESIVGQRPRTRGWRRSQLPARR
jgi:hypothetical protein